MKNENKIKNISIIILLFILSGLLFLSCSSFKNNNITDDLYYYPDQKQQERDSIVKTYYNYNYYSPYFSMYHHYPFYFNNWLYDFSFDPYWLENYLMYPNYFYGLNTNQIYFSLRSYGFDSYFSNYYAYNYYRYYNRNWNPYMKYRWHITTPNNKSNDRHKKIVRKPRKSFNSTYKAYMPTVNRNKINITRESDLNAKIPIYRINKLISAKIL